MTDLVTGEAVVLELRPAKLASRALSLAIDVSAQLTLLLIGTLVLAGVAGGVDDALAAAIGLVFVVLVVVGYPAAFETFSRGRTLGKLALGLRVVRADGGPIRARHALVRALLAVVEIWLTAGSVALIASLAATRGTRLGDLLAGTLVVRERVPAGAAPPVVAPPELAGWASGLDLSRVPDDLALAVRQFLARSPELAAEIREGMGGRLAASLAACTSPPPPPGTPAWAFLAAVLAERRDRESARLGARPGQPGWPGWPPYGDGTPAWQRDDVAPAWQRDDGAPAWQRDDVAPAWQRDDGAPAWQRGDGGPQYDALDDPDPVTRRDATRGDATRGDATRGDPIPEDAISDDATPDSGVRAPGGPFAPPG